MPKNAPSPITDAARVNVSVWWPSFACARLTNETSEPFVVGAFAAVVSMEDLFNRRADAHNGLTLCPLTRTGALVARFFRG